MQGNNEQNYDLMELHISESRSTERAPFNDAVTKCRHLSNGQETLPYYTDRIV